MYMRIFWGSHTLLFLNLGNIHMGIDFYYSLDFLHFKYFCLSCAFHDKHLNHGVESWLFYLGPAESIWEHTLGQCLKLFHKLGQETFSSPRLTSFLVVEIRKVNLDKSSCRSVFTCNISNSGEKWRERWALESIHLLGRVPAAFQRTVVEIVM